MIFAHSFVGVTSTFAVLKLTKPKLHKKELDLIWFVGIIAAVFPDFDISILVFNNLFNHRESITHSLIPYLILSLAIYATGFIYKNKRQFFKTLSLVFFTGILTHIILDSLVGGVAFLIPLSYTNFGINLPFDTKKDFWVLGYFSSYYMLWELLVILPYFYIRRKVKVFWVNTLPWVLFAIATLTSIALMFY